MANVFDAAAANVVKATDVFFGYQATWGAYTATVKYKDIEGEAKLGDVKYGVDNWKIEFKDSDFPGLKDSINKNHKEPISVNVRGTVLNFLGIVANAVSDGMLTEVKLRLTPQ